MDVSLSAEQSLFAATAREIAERLATRDPSAIMAPGTADDAWRRVVDLGVPSLRSPALSGIDASGVECALAIEALATTLAPVPSVGQAVIVPEMLAAAGASDTAAAVAAGDLRLAPALTRDLAGFARTTDDAIAFDTWGATHAVLLRIEDGNVGLVAHEFSGPALDGLDLTRELRPVDTAGPAAAIDLGRVISAERWLQVEACALTALAADLVGVMQGALDDAVAYACERRQFGVPIGSFQAVQHLAADALVRVEGARSCVWHAAWALGRLPNDEALLTARTAKAYASSAARDVVEASVQILGGIAITWEALSHVRLRRVLLDRAALGDEHVHDLLIADHRLRNRAVL